MNDDHLPSSPITSSSRWLMAGGIALAGLVTTTLANGPVVLWCGLAIAVLPGISISWQSDRSRSGIYLAAAALAIAAVGLLVLTRGNPIGAVPLIAGIGALAGWLPFCWSVDGKSDRTFNLTSVGLQLIGMTTALVAAARLIPAAFAQNASVAEPVLFLAAAVTLIVASARLASWRRTNDVILALTGMAACGIAADVVLRQGASTLPVSIVRGDVAGMAVWLHGTAVWVLLNSFGRDSSLLGWRARTWLVPLLAADIAGLPPLPGFWLRGNLLLSLVSRQTASSITGEYEPHAGMLMLAILVTIAWGAMMTTAISAIADANTDDGTAAAS